MNHDQKAAHGRSIKVAEFINNEKSNSATPSGRRSFAVQVTTVLLLVGLFVLLALIFWTGAQILMLLFAGILVALILRTAANTLSRWTRLGVRWTMMIVLLFVLVSGGLIFWIAAPGVSEQVLALRENLEESFNVLTEALEELPGASAVEEQIDQLQEEGANGKQIWKGLAGIFSNIFGALAGIAIVLISAIFLAFDPQLYLSGILRMVPPPRRARASEVLSELGSTLQGWLFGQLIAMLFLFVSTWILLMLLGIPLAFILALLAGALTFVPYIGPLLAIVPILLIAFAESPTLALYAGIVFLVVQNVEGNVLMPIVFQRTVHLPPVLTIVGQLTLGALFGILGFILATPLTAVLLVLVQQLYVKDTLGDSMKTEIENLPTLPNAPPKKSQSD